MGTLFLARTNMANRRMFSLDVVDTDHFVDMSATARLLYYDLGVRADDDGFITPKRVMRMTGASEDDLKILVAKGFIHVFEDGVVVILQWCRNNYIDAKKYRTSVYFPRLKDLKKKGAYVESNRKVRLEISSESQPVSAPVVHEKSTDSALKVHNKCTQDRLGKDSIVKNKETAKSRTVKPYAIPKPDLLGQDSDIEKIFAAYNKTFGKQLKTSPAIAKNLAYWLQVYSVEDMELAIALAKKDEWFGKHLTPVMLLRRKNTAGEDVDYIGSLLATKAGKTVPQRQTEAYTAPELGNISESDRSLRLQRLQEIRSNLVSSL